MIHENGRIETIRTADDHPFYLVTPGTPPVRTEASLLRGTDLLATMSGPATVESVRFSSDRATVYNLIVAGTSNYYIVLDGVLVHNGGDYRAAFEAFLGRRLDSAMEVHHRVPQRFKQSKGGPIPDEEIDDVLNLAAVHELTHRLITSMWQAWANRNPGASADQVRAFKYEVDFRFLGEYVLR